MQIKGFFKGKSFIFLVFLLLLLSLSIGSIFSALGVLSGRLFWPAASQEGNLLQQPPNFLKWLQFFSMTGFMLVPALIFNYLTDNRVLSYVKVPAKLFWGGLVLLIALLPMVDFSFFINHKLIELLPSGGLKTWIIEAEQTAKDVTKLLLNNNHSLIDLLYNILIIAILPAISEELLFRGVLQKLFIERIKNEHIGVLLTAILFSAMHMQFVGFLPRFLLGTMLGYMMIVSQNISLPIFIHFTNNAATILIVYFYPDIDATEPFTNNNIWVLLLSTIISIALFLNIWKNRIINKDIKTYTSV